MAGKRIKRQAATPRGVERRVKDARFEEVQDPRSAAHRRFELSPLLGLLVYGLASGATSLRAAEVRTEQIRDSVRRELGLPDERVADNTLGRVLRRVSSLDLRQCLQRQVKAELKRKRLGPATAKDSPKLKKNRHVVAIDGKALSSLYLRELQQATRQVLKDQGDARAQDKDWTPAREDIEVVFAGHFPNVKLFNPDDGEMYGTVMVHRATLVSTDAAVCVDQRPIAGKCNEVGEMPATVDELFRVYRRTGLLDIVTADAGNVSLKVANRIRHHGADYFLGLKGNQSELRREAASALEQATDDDCIASASEERSGNTVTYRCWHHGLSDGHLGWKHLRQILRIERTTINNQDEVKTENRYFVTSIAPDELDGEDALTLARMHWRCENEGHWTSDVFLKEDAKRQEGSRHPAGILARSYLAMIAQNILAVLRALSRIGPALLRPRWADALAHVAAVIFDLRLDTSAFDDIEGAAFPV